MATRSLTDAYVLMRNRAAQSRQLLAEQIADDRMALVSGISLDPEAAIGVTKKLPPKWVDGVEQMFHRCQRSVQSLQGKWRSCTEQEERVLRNVISSLAQALQDLSTTFRHAQSNYLKRLKNREERSKHFFDTSVPLMDDGEDNNLYDKGFTNDQLLLVEENTLMVEEREKEIRQIVQSISDLNEIFRELASMIVEQGTILDQIDYNVEQSCIKTEEGLQQLQKAEQYQKKNRKMLVILILFVIVVVLIIVLIGVKSR
ncbi:syntaxin-16 isoform X5 [Mustelus asterias]